MLTATQSTLGATLKLAYDIQIYFDFFCLGLTELTFCQLRSTAGTYEDSTTNSYVQIDSSLRNEIESDFQNWKAGNALIKYQALTNVEIFKNDKEVYTTYGKSKIPLTILPGAFVNEKDSIISIIGYLGSKEQKAGFEIYIKNEECVVVFFVKRTDGGQVFKTEKSDEKYTSYLHRRAQYHLTLTQKPTFKKGDVIEGLVELRSWEYYEKGETGDDKYNMIFFAFFKTDPLK